MANAKNVPFLAAECAKCKVLGKKMTFTNLHFSVVPPVHRFVSLPFRNGFRIHNLLKANPEGFTEANPIAEFYFWNAFLKQLESSHLKPYSGITKTENTQNPIVLGKFMKFPLFISAN